MNCGWIRPVMCGSYINASIDLDARRGLSINDLNPYLNEFSILHWLEKNHQIPRIAGMVHYRKYFDFFAPPQVAWRHAYLTEPTDSELSRLSAPEVQEHIQSILNRHDVICPRPVYMQMSIKEHYLSAHEPRAWTVFEQAIRDVAPMYGRHIDFFENSNRFTFFGMMITHHDIFLNYIRTVTKILLRLIELMPPEIHDDAKARFRNHRYPAFLGERFFMLYLHVNRLQLHEATIAHLEDAS